MTVTFTWDLGIWICFAPKCFHWKSRWISPMPEINYYPYLNLLSNKSTVTNAVEHESITLKRNSFLLFSILTIAVFTYPRSVLIIKVYKIFLVPVLSKLLIMTLLYISQEKQLVKFSKFTFWLFAICFYKLPSDSFLVSSFQMIIAITSHF